MHDSDDSFLRTLFRFPLTTKFLNPCIYSLNDENLQPARPVRGEPTMTPKPHVPAPLDPDFQPAVLRNRRYVKAAHGSGIVAPLVLGLEREGGLLSRYATILRADD